MFQKYVLRKSKHPLFVPQLFPKIVSFMRQRGKIL